MRREGAVLKDHLSQRSDDGSLWLRPFPFLLVNARRRSPIRQSVIRIRMRNHLDLLQEEQRNDAQPRNTDHTLPNNAHTLREGVPHLRPQRFFQIANLWDGRIGDLDAAGELGDERGGERFLQLVLEDRAGDGDSPGLGEGTDEGEEGDGGGVVLDGQRGEDGEHRAWELEIERKRGLKNEKIRRLFVDTGRKTRTRRPAPAAGRTWYPTHCAVVEFARSKLNTPTPAVKKTHPAMFAGRYLPQI